jgi:hypothetical protein
MQQVLTKAVPFAPDFCPVRTKLLIYYGNSMNARRYSHSPAAFYLLLLNSIAISLFVKLFRINVTEQS